ncbi:uncharacterized protein NECHADRAFT_100788 [Fusarium vanettenii 77-13-4]|uniref:Uncharacterized protein n=1 Tax=Fusarium vanettenii (strain ATCC MYA-4622 / CBS 123669 / FGSC 9596 / NRRL 45880 / 77-13-4) TaxID=660122 RepID=C7ZKU2_FUSV7|nr:uncharacterized protein NECHADRAFT_100788 [Fusarium vanettenii 77-13-4]EEU35389.1 hypothetical protein NECHADRAFT_100788 [Fusarium vanettenii 77-13-4]
MLSSSFLGLVLATTVSAAPFQGLNSTRWTPEHILQPDEVILYGEGRMEVVHESVYHSLIASDGISEDIPEVPEAFPAPSHPFKAPKSSNDNSLSKRQCDLTTAVVTDRTQTFVDWDVQMSPVIIGTGDGITVSVTSGYSVSNSVSVSGGADWTVVKDKLGLSFGVDYSRTWTSSASINIAAKVADGYSGVMITKPIKTRKYGRVLKGCIGSQTESGTFSADSFEEKEYAGIKWVSGAITLCSKKEFPLSRCTGSGNFV